MHCWLYSPVLEVLHPLLVGLLAENVQKYVTAKTLRTSWEHVVVIRCLY